MAEKSCRSVVDVVGVVAALRVSVYRVVEGLAISHDVTLLVREQVPKESDRWHKEPCGVEPKCRDHSSLSFTCK